MILNVSYSCMMWDNRGRFLIDEIIYHFGNFLITGPERHRRGINLSYDGIAGFKLNFYLSRDNVDTAYLQEWYSHFAEALGKKFSLHITSFHQ